jgi:ATP-binding cassette subfamily C protein
MIPRLGTAWQEVNLGYLLVLEGTSDISNLLGAFSKVLRMVIQSAVLGLGAYLVVNQQATGGIIIAASIITARALAPLDVFVANWKNFLSARQSWQRLSKMLAAVPIQQSRTTLARPTHFLSVEGISVTPPGGSILVVDGVSFVLTAGHGLGILGPNASGKSSLVKALVGIWPTVRGKIRLDGAALEDWVPDVRAGDIGYLPQEVELLGGTVAQNIARFDPNADSSAIIAAANAAGVHHLVLRLPQAYETQIGEGGCELSAGQRQRIGLARALYGDPFLVVLDEPDSNLDAEGEEALTRSILNVRKRGGIAVVIAHRPSVLAAVDVVLVLNQGRVQATGPTDEILKKLKRGPADAAYGGVTASWTPPIKAVADIKAESSR